MDNITLERYWTDPAVKAEIEGAARRERARVLKRFLEQSAQALLGRGSQAQRAPGLTPCEAC
jgi:hypothetical protein